MSGSPETPLAPPPLPTTPDPVKAAFAYQWMPYFLNKGMERFLGTILSGDGPKVLSEAWIQLSSLNLPPEHQLPPDGIDLECFSEDSRMVVIVKFLPPCLADEPYFGAVVTDRCADPEWSSEATRNLGHRYFVLFRAPEGTYVEEWTREPQLYLGEGSEPETLSFLKWVLEYAVRGEANEEESASEEPLLDEASAIERARREFPDVAQRFAAGELQEFAVKVAIKEESAAEDFWLADTRLAKGYFCGVIDVHPQKVSSVQRGDEIRAAVENIVDWRYMADGKMYGNYTLRAALPSMPPSQAEPYMAVLAKLE